MWDLLDMICKKISQSRREKGIILILLRNSGYSKINFTSQNYTVYTWVSLEVSH